MLSILQSNLPWIAAIFVGIYVYLKFVTFAYWTKLGVPSATSTLPIIKVLPVALGIKSVGDFLKENYEKYKNHRFSGMYVLHKPVLMLNDPELIRRVLVKDFNKFSSRGIYCNERDDPLTSNVFLLSGDTWKKLRGKFTPTFTSSKLKEMFLLVKEISDKLMKTCERAIAEDGDVVEMKDLYDRYTIDSISSIAFGFDCKSLEASDNEFKRHALMAFDMSPIRIAIATFAPTIFETLRYPALDKRMTKFFSKTFRDMIEYRRQSNVVRKDFLNLLMQLMDKGVLDDDQDGSLDRDKLSMVQAQGHAFIFLLAGYETTSSTLTYLSYELAMNPEIQEKVHREIDEFFANGEVTYDRVNSELKYLDMVLSETLRNHSAFSSLNRKCVEDWQIPDSNIKVEKGTGIIISINGLHHDPDIYPNPEKFNPTRFSEENIASRSPYVYLPFGAGPRSCIGIRLGTLQSKITTLTLLREYKLCTCDKTVIPMQYSKKAFVQSPGTGVYLRLVKRVKNMKH